MVAIYKIIKTIWHQPGLIKTFFLKLKSNGWKKAFDSLRFNFSDKVSYPKWCRLSERLLETQVDANGGRPNCPLISLVVLVLDGNDSLLNKTIESIQDQLYENWELCIAATVFEASETGNLLKKYSLNDSRIKVKHVEKEIGSACAYNLALEMCSGQYVVFVKQNDELHRFALHYVAWSINDNPDLELIYTDEDEKTVTGKRKRPYFKTEFGYDLFLSKDMMGNLSLYSIDMIRKAGGFHSKFSEALHYDLKLRILEKINVSDIKHIPRVLYHNRKATKQKDEVTFTRSEECLIAVREHLKRTNVSGEVFPQDGTFTRVNYSLPRSFPFVEIIIPTKDHGELLKKCVDSITSKTTYPNYKITIIDNSSTEGKTFELFCQYSTVQNIDVVTNNSEFNYSKLNNSVALKSEADFVCLLNNDIEIITPGWLEEMVSLALQPNVGCVGARLLYPDDRLQHAGVVLGMIGIAGHVLRRFPKKKWSESERATLRHTVSAVTGACMLVSSDIYKKLNGLEEQLAVAYNDVDFCLRVQGEGYRNVWTPYAEMYHYESAQRGRDSKAAEKIHRHAREEEFMRKRWGDKLKKDPYYSPNLTLVSEDYSLAYPRCK